MSAPRPNTRHVDGRGESIKNSARASPRLRGPPRSERRALQVAGRQLGALICFEVLSRSLTAEAWAAGAELQVTLASDLPRRGGPVVSQQCIGIRQI